MHGGRVNAISPRQSWKARESRASVGGPEKTDVPALAESKFTFPWPVCSIQALDGLDDAQGHWGEQSALLSLWIQMLISSRNTLTDTLRNKVLPAI